ncbi:MAG: preprotein translocase subunit SecY [Chlamydiae bacterium CG10_big_fil_rev_8_21_14_0_10_42_34]|nr:MAG: preprotein translocase subunit SecY [Chlamydiae bacterium CG10_big_fil_rev_8_21_14_0_10_42_34]
MVEAIRRIFGIPELRVKILYTLLLLGACRIGAYVPVPGVNAEAAISLFKFASGGGQNLFQLVDIFSGGAFAKMTVLALGVMPYITASIIMQLLVALVPSLQRDIRESPDQGRRKLSKWTRMATLVISLFQSAAFAGYVVRVNLSSPGIIVSQLADVQIFGVSWLFYLTVMVTMTTGTLFLMWIGEQISEKGVGNGISLIIALGILASFPSTIGSIISQLNLESQEAGQLTFPMLIVLCALFVFITVGTILVIQGQRRIPLQYARRIVGRHEVQGGNSHIPLKVNYAGVIPVIFASSLLMFPATVGQFLGRSTWLGQLSNYFLPGTWVYMAMYIMLILFFTYFWTATQFKPEQIASDMKKNGAFIPGIRQGKPTQDYLESTMSRITLAGAVFLAIIAILPTLVGRLMGVDASISQFFGGTSLLILVGVILDTTKQIESHLLMKRYEGFMTKGKLRGR